MSVLTRKEREKLRHRKEILEAAEKVFARLGYHETSIQEIARVAEFSVGSIYNFFESKEELYSSILRMRLEELHQRVKKETAKIKDPLEKLKKIVKIKFRMLEEHRNFFMVFFDFSKGPGLKARAGVDKYVINLYREHLALMEQLFEQAVWEGKIKKIDPKCLAVALEGISNNFIEHFSRLKKISRLGELVPVIEEIFFKGILT